MLNLPDAVFLAIHPQSTSQPEVCTRKNMFILFPALFSEYIIHEHEYVLAAMINMYIFRDMKALLSFFLNKIKTCLVKSHIHPRVWHLSFWIHILNAFRLISNIMWNLSFSYNMCFANWGMDARRGELVEETNCLTFAFNWYFQLSTHLISTAEQLLEIDPLSRHFLSERGFLIIMESLRRMEASDTTT